jgi:hypothetical protein
LSPFEARVRSHAVRRRLFIVLMTAAYISHNVFSLRNFLSNIHRLLLTVHATSFISFIHHIYTHIYTFYLPVYVSFLISLLRIFMAGRLPSVPCVRYKYKFFKYIRLNEVHSRNKSAIPSWKGGCRQKYM